MIYTYLRNKEDLDHEIPFSNKDLFDKYVGKYPTKYPCILEFEDYSSDDQYHYHFNIIHDMSNFIYQNGYLYKKC